MFAYLTGGVALLLLLAGLGLTRAIAAWLQGEFDRGLLTKAQALAALTDQEGDLVEIDFEAEHMPEFGAGAAAEYFEAWLAGETLLLRSPSFEASDGTRRARLERGPGPADTPQFRDVPLPDGRRGRQVRLDFLPRLDVEEGPVDPAEPAGAGPTGAARRPATLLVARERDSLDASLGRLRWAVGAVGAVLLLAVAGLAHVALRVGLRSLDELGRQVRALGATSLDARVRVDAPPAEIAVVVEQVNGLLARLEAAFTRERRLSSDIAHELKTPIAELRNLCEVGARWPEDRVAVRRFFEDARAVALQMERVVVHLVALARYEEGREPMQRVRVLVPEIVETAWRPLARAAAAKRLAFRQEIAPDLAFVTDPDTFALMVANLLSNAVAHSPAGGAVTCTSATGAGRPSVTFSNPAHGLEPADLAVMFDRFWRKDEARAGGRYAGLGLSLVRAAGDLLGIEIGTRLEPDGTFRVTLSPRVEPPDQNRNWTSAPTTQASSASRKAVPGRK
jgi:signal transduction histidine kinase